MICCSCGVFSTHCFWSANPATQFGIKMAADVGSDPKWSRERGWGKFQFQSIQPLTSKTIEYQRIHKINFGEALLRGGSFWACIGSHIHNIHVSQTDIVEENMVSRVWLNHQTILHEWGEKDHINFYKIYPSVTKGVTKQKWQTQQDDDIWWNTEFAQL